MHNCFGSIGRRLSLPILLLGRRTYDGIRTQAQALGPSFSSNSDTGHDGRQLRWKGPRRWRTSLWPEVIGSIRGRTFVLTQQVIGAEEAKMLGVVSEIVTRDRLLHRAREIAGRIARLPPLT